MKKWIAIGMGLALMAGLTPRVQAQAPAPPPQAAAAAGMLGQLKEACAALKELLCKKCCLIQLMNSALKPIGGMAGCPISICPDEPTPADLAKPGEEGAAAKIKKDEIECKARRAAVRYLGTVDCHYWYDVAEPALIGALRGDRCECVRLEAAIALGRGCCCTKKTMAALVITVNGSDIDDNPSETSERVKAAAAVALAHCLSCYAEVKAAGKEDGGRVSLPAADKKNQPVVAASARGYTDYYNRVLAVPMDKVVEAGNKTLAKTNSPIAPEAVAHQGTGHSVFEIVKSAVTGPTSTSPLHPVATEQEPARAEQTTRYAPQPQTTTVIRQTSYQVPVTSEPYRRPIPAPVPAARPQPQAQATTGVVNHRQMLALLRESAYTEQRQWAADNVTYFDWTISPEIVESLVIAARKDSAPSVRVACLRSLAKMNVQTEPVVATVRALKMDADPQVRAEADLALNKLGASRTR